MSAQIKTAPARRGRTRKTEKPSLPTLTEPSPTCNDRTPDGRFAKDNPGGPGNPHARHCARMLALLRASISEEEMVAIFRMLVEKARAGDVSAAKLLLSYKLGKPASAPNPDEIDRDEWEHFQRDTINLQEVQQVLGSLSASVGNDIARTALPIVTQAQKEALASQLVKNLPTAHKPTQESEVANQQPREAAPIANGKSSESNRATQNDNRPAITCRATLHGSESTPKDPGKTNDNRHSTNESRFTHHAPRSTSPAPIPNRKSKRRQHGKTKPKKIKPEWLRQTARRMQESGPANE